MRNTRIHEKEYALIVNLMIFFVVIAIVGYTRTVAILTNNEISSSISIEESMYLNYDKTVDFKVSNLNLIKALKTVYGIDIYYGATSQTLTNSVNATTIQDEEEVFNMLSNVIKALSKYPISFIKEMSKKGYKLDVFLVDHFVNGNIAVANRNSNNEFKIYLSNTSQVERAMHHEIYHIMEYYIKLEDNLDTRYASWNTFNPKNFSYSSNINNLDFKYVYGHSAIQDAYFLTLYSKFSAKEDRAELFAESMMLEAEPSYYNTQTRIKSKVMLMDNVLKNCFTSFKESKEKLLWEEYI